MNHRERVLAALRHQEPDRVPIDLGSTGDTGILVEPYRNLRRRLGLEPTTIRICNPISRVVYVEEDVRQALGIDVDGVYYQPNEWRRETLSDGSPVDVPARWTPETQEDGSRVIWDASGNVLFKTPSKGYYFEPMYSPLADATSVQDLEEHLDIIENYDRPSYLDMPYEDLEKVARDLYVNTDYLLVGFFGGHIFAGALQLRGYQNFLVDLIINSGFAEALMDRLAEGHMRRFARFAETVGKYLHVVHVEDDLGMQDRGMISPDVYRTHIKPYHSRLYQFIKQNCDAKLMLHTDGSVYSFIPDFIEMGIDILNPLQHTAKDMNARRLKAEFGDALTFWGGGCDTQRVLPYGTPTEVKEEVKRQIDELAPGGGFVFCQVHNIQPQTPVENIMAMYEAVREYGSY